MLGITNSVLELIGNTPLVRLSRIAAHLRAEILAKVEFTNPGGSLKDRAALWAIEGAEREGRLRPGGVVVEGTSGNMGIGLAIVCPITGANIAAALKIAQNTNNNKKIVTTSNDSSGLKYLSTDLFD
jgi:cysteine synthase